MSATSMMPSVAAFAKHALRFERAYAPGSDTATSLPVIVRGSYALDAGSARRAPTEASTHRDLLRLATAAGYDGALMVPRSAREYLAREVPSFRFATTVEVADYSGEREVWGYGADQPSAAKLVDHAIDFLKRPRNQPFLLWVFHYDLHNWGELRTEHLRAVAAEHGIGQSGSHPWRYRATAASIDREVGRLLDALAQSRHREDTIVVFFSDHGESLGQRGLLAHSVYLWESLLRVPLLLRFPGVAPATISTAVSLVDLAPTLALSIDRTTAVAGYHGEDLLLRTLPNAPARRLPMLFSATQGGQLVRIGILDPKRPLKLVWHLSAATPALLSLSAPDPDGTDVSSQHPLQTARLLQSLVRSPVFPRTIDGP